MKRLAALFLLPALIAPALAQDEAPKQDPAPAEQPAPPAAAPQDLELTLQPDRAEVPVGESIALTVTLKNAGSAPAEVPELAEDVQLVSFEVRLDDGEAFSHHKIHTSIYEPRTDWPTVQLAPGETQQLRVELPALTTGQLTVTAKYGRPVTKEEGQVAFGPAKLSSEPVQVKLTPTAEGDGEVEVRMHTNLGPMHLRLFPRHALGTALHFARLIEDGRREVGERSVPFYRGLTFHRVIEGFMIQGGCPEGTGNGGPGYSIPAETGAKGELPEEQKHAPGRLAMARSPHRDSAGSQFYICVGAPSHLDGDYTVFGEVTRGLDVAYAIAGVPTGGASKPLEPVTIDAITLQTVPQS